MYLVKKQWMWSSGSDGGNDDDDDDDDDDVSLSWIYQTELFDSLKIAGPSGVRSETH
jgi:hypothetical protein